MDKFHLAMQLDASNKIQAKEDLIRCQLKDREKIILLSIIEGVKIAELSALYKLPRQNIHYIYKIALVKIWRELGPREWIRLQSKDKIEDWNIMIPKFPNMK
jgi:hypothetical protein